MKWLSVWDYDVLRHLPTERRYDNSNHCRFGLVNALPLRNKCKHFVVTENIDFCVVVESWIKDSDTFEMAKLKTRRLWFP
ncbi:hypothetical protein HOLleu_31266 [Holothuria leucospilota]|uniref:Uncharacterized protein n=1 Tax=Holothuria leucospilota TaxID=206669 RepID=A0A9Q1BIC1_HOLLE|nr:hypothetical protein HOLleu_31266 [Holothuria leucospilota]